VNAKWTRLWFALFVVMIFLAGIATGMVIDRRFGPPPPQTLAGRGPGRGMGAGLGLRGGAPPAHALVERLSTDLKLNTDQKTKLEKILTDRRTRMEQFNRDVRTRFETEQQELRSEIRTLLSPGQQKQFDEWLKWNPLGGGPPGRRGGGPPGAGARQQGGPFQP
jgi:hypothetical protein